LDERNRPDSGGEVFMSHMVVLAVCE
jgi:hypothetical protein